MSKKLKATKTKMYHLVSDYLAGWKIEYFFDVPAMRECRYKKLYGYRTYILDFVSRDYYVKCTLSSGMGSGYIRMQISEYEGDLLKEKFIHFSLDTLDEYNLLEECA